MSYFVYFLRIEHYGIPWTFILLFSISLATLVALLVTIVLYNFTYLAPKFNLCLNGSIAAFWCLAYALLSWSISSSHVLARSCSTQEWGGVTEAGVCRDYKALWSMTLGGTISTIAALALDVHTHRKTIKQGNYVLPEDDKEAVKLNETKSAKVRREGYEAPEEQAALTASVLDEADIAYHNRYGASVEDLHGTSATGWSTSRGHEK